MRFKSFFWAGFECATGLNRHRIWIDQVEATAHERFADNDYAMAAAAGLSTVREGIRWPIVDKGGGYDFRSVAPMVRAAQRHEIEVVWDLFHYGYPPELDPFADEFVRRFAAYCFEAASYVSKRLAGPHRFTPVNEPSYLAWAAGEACRFAPHLCGRARELKVQLCRAAIEGADAIWRACPDAVMVQADPVCRIVPPLDMPELQENCDHFNEHAVFEAMDILAGRLHPELGGSARHLGVMGINYYWTNQWEIFREEEPLAPNDSRLWPLREIVRAVHRRYGAELVIAETAHSGDRRAPWLRAVAQEAEVLLREGVPLRGVCLYPVLGMPEWHDPEEWARMGLWDVDSRTWRRRLHKPTFNALREAQERLEPLLATPAPVETSV